jgi:hypothetical protein
VYDKYFKKNVKSFYDEILQDYCFNTVEKKFKIIVFYLTLNNEIIQLKEYFTTLNNIFKRFEITQPNSLINFTNEQILNSANKLVKYYYFHLSNTHVGQIVLLRSGF